jgi:hypothetical protein
LLRIAAARCPGFTARQISPFFWLAVDICGRACRLLYRDFMSGVVHWRMDTWADEPTFGRAVAIAREHAPDIPTSVISGMVR